MKVGDLICYNAAGQRKKSLGLVIDKHVRTDNGGVSGVDVFYRIHWTKRGEVMPREEWGCPRHVRFYRHGPENTKKKGWYKAGCWFEVINESR